MEGWVDISGYEGLYQINYNGQIKRDGRLLIPTLGKVGYFVIYLCKHGIAIRYFVHRLIAQTFIPNPDNKDQVNHINGIKHDNRIENLEWATHKENAIHAMKNNLHPVSYDKVMTKERIERVFDLYSHGYTQKEIGEILGVNQSVISRVLNKKRKQYLLIT